MKRWKFIVIGLVTGLGLADSAQAGQAFFSGLGDLPGGWVFSSANAVSSDGQFAVGGSTIGGSIFVPLLGAFGWTDDVGLFSVYQDLGAGASVQAFGVSADGGAIVGVADFGGFGPLGRQAFLWSQGGVLLLDDLPGGASGVPQSYGRGVSGDGTVIVGIGQSDAGTEAFRYLSSNGGMEGLGDLPGGVFGSYAHAVSSDGMVVVGASYSGPQQQVEAFRWTEAEGMVGLGFLPTLPGTVKVSQAQAVSADGSVIVGESSTENAVNGNEAFRWTADGGLVALGDLPGGLFQSWAYAVSADGSVVAGRASIAGIPGPFGGGSMPRAFIWDGVNGIRDLQAMLIDDFGLDLTGWNLHEARGLSADGRTIVGSGLNPAGYVEAWIAHLPSTGVSIVGANPPADNPFIAGQQPFRDVLQTGTTPAVTQGIGAAGTPSQGTVNYGSISVTFSDVPSPLPDLFNVSVSCTSGDCPFITSVFGFDAVPYDLTLSGPIPPGACTTFAFAGASPGQELQYQFLPGDSNMNGLVSASDVQALVAAIASGQAALAGNLPRYNINRVGGVTNSDVLRLVGLLNGADTTAAWLGATVSACP